jgi:hypothetical protein
MKVNKLNSFGNKYSLPKGEKEEDSRKMSKNTYEFAFLG